MAAAVGAVLAEWLRIPWVPAWWLTLLLAGTALWARRWWLSYAFVSMAFLTIHTLRHFESPARALAGLHANGRTLVRGTGIVASEPLTFTHSNGSSETSFRLALLSLDQTEVKPGATPVMVRWRNGTAVRGDVLQFAGSLSDIESARNPGQFNFGAYQKRLGVHSALTIPTAGDAAKIGERAPPTWWLATHRTQSWMRRTLEAGIADDREVSSVIQSMTLGYKSEVPEETNDHFVQTGTLHIFTVSGLHVGLLGLIVMWILSAFGFSRRTSAIILLPMIWFYAALADFSSGSVRASAMGSVVLVGILFRRPPLTWNSYFAAFFLVLAWDTEQLFMPGFQFSFGVVASILLLAGPVYSALKRVGAPDPFLPQVLWRWADRARHAAAGKAAGLVSTSFSAWIGSLYFTAQFFHLLSPSALLANLLVVPMGALILAEAVFALLAGCVSTTLAALFNNANWVCVKALLLGVEFFANLPGGYRYVEMPTLGERPAIEIVSFDLGDGGATAVWVSGEVWLIDSGGGIPYRGIVRPYLRSRGVNRLDGFIATHGDSLHLGGGVEMLEEFRPRRVLTSAVTDRSPTRSAFEHRLTELDVPREKVAAGDVITLNPETSWRVLSPRATSRGRQSDDSALVLQLRMAQRRVLFSSDIGFASELALQDDPDLRSDVLVKGMHRSDFSGTPDFLRAVHAGIVVEGNRVPFGGMPLTPLSAAMIDATGGRFFQHHETGAVRVRLWPDRHDVQTFLPYHRFVSRNE